MVNKYPDYEIVNLDLLTYAGNLETLKPVEDKPNYKFVKGDIADEPFIMDLFEKERFDVVVNFAADYIVHFSHPAVVDNKVNGLAVVPHMEPVPDILPFPVHRQLTQASPRPSSGI